MAWRSVDSDAASDDPLAPSGSAYVPPSFEPGSGGVRFANDPEQKLRAAHQRGMQEGRQAARSEMNAQLEAIEARMARSIEEMSGLRRRFRQEAEEDVVALALAIARRILHRELTMAPDALLGLVKAALEKMGGREVQRVRVSPEDAPLVKQYLDKMGLPQRVEVIADPTLERGALMLDSSRGTLDASVETQIEEIDRGLADLVRRAR
jgi:flagellar assembly protein FliH